VTIVTAVATTDDSDDLAQQSRNPSPHQEREKKPTNTKDTKGHEAAEPQPKNGERESPQRTQGTQREQDRRGVLLCLARIGLNRLFAVSAFFAADPC
jgi:hypothetical protein